MTKSSIAIFDRSFSGQDVKAVTASQLYEFLELDPRNYSRWVRSCLTNNKFAIENIDYSRLFVDDESEDVVKYSNLKDNRKSDYVLTIEFAKKLAMMSKSKRGEEVRQYFIEVEKQWKTVQLSTPKTFSEALRLAAEQQEKIEQLQLKSAEDAPKVAFHDAVHDTEDAIDVEMFAKATYTKFQLGRNLMFTKLRALGYLKADNRPYQEYIQQGLFRVIEIPLPQIDRVASKTLITPKGQVLLIAELGERCLF